jgi:hypothetical protein
VAEWRGIRSLGGVVHYAQIFWTKIVCLILRRALRQFDMLCYESFAPPAAGILAFSIITEFWPSDFRLARISAYAVYDGSTK